MIAEAKDNEEIILSLDNNGIKGKTLTPFYVYVAECMGYANEAIETFDCRKIWVAENVQDAIIEAYKETCPEEYEEYPIEVEHEIMRILAIGGPKMNEELSNNQVKVEAGFITFKDVPESKEETACA